MKILTENGQHIFNRIRAHCLDLGIPLTEADDIEMEALAHNFDLYFRMAEYCNQHGYTQSPANGGWDQVRPEYTIMSKCYTFIVRHSGKYGLNPGDRVKLKLGTKEQPDPLDELNLTN